MSSPSPGFDFRRLSVADRLALVEEIWDSIVAEQSALEVTQSQKEELDRRLATIEKRPNRASPWEEVISRLRARQ